MSAAGVTVGTACDQQAGAGSTPSAALQERTMTNVRQLEIRPIPWHAAKAILESGHYLHSLPGGTRLCFGVFQGKRLAGAMTFGVGPKNVHRLVQGATPDDVATLTRLWLSDNLPTNSESRVLGVIVRALRRYTSLKFLVSYADPTQGHVGTIYQATGWLYTGLSEAMPLYDLGDGRRRHSRTLSHAFGTHSVAHFKAKGVTVRKVPQSAKHRYIHFLDRSWRERLNVSVLPYPKRQEAGSEDR